MRAVDIQAISLSRGPCFGSCPIFRFTANRHYGYTYHGHAYVEPLGDRTGPFPGYLFDRLAETSVELRIAELDDVYPCDFDDAPFVIITIRHTGGEKVVRNEGGDSGPVRIWAFAALIEVAMRQVFGIEDRDALRKTSNRKNDRIEDRSN